MRCSGGVDIGTELVTSSRNRMGRDIRVQVNVKTTRSIEWDLIGTGTVMGVGMKMERHDQSETAGDVGAVEHRLRVTKQ